VAIVAERIQMSAQSVDAADLVQLFEGVVTRDDTADVVELGTGGHHLRQKLLEYALLRQLVGQSCPLLFQLRQFRPQSKHTRVQSIIDIRLHPCCNAQRLNL